MAATDSAPASGTRDLLPDEVSRRNRVFASIRSTFERSGFAPIETPSFERIEVLTGKYGDEGDQLIFRILKRGDQAESGEADLALRYDLTVPLARYVAANSQLGTPFKRYHIGNVWRADRPGHGRFREFTQCDIDTVGADSLVADAETLLTLDATLTELGLSGYNFELNSRQALFGLIEAYGVPSELEAAALVTIDKFDKIGAEGVARELVERSVPVAAVDRLAADLSADDAADRVRALLESNERGRLGLAEVDRVLELVGDHMGNGTVSFTPHLARGLSYYTGPIFEIKHAGLGSSIGSGGRYDGLVGMFIGRDVPTTGGSLGVERILMLLADDDAGAVGPDVLITVMGDEFAVDAVSLASDLRAAGISTDLFVGDGRMKKQLKYADRRGVRFAVVRGEQEAQDGTVALKDLRTGDQVAVAVADLVGHLHRQLA